MDWINVVDKLPKSGQRCLGYVMVKESDYKSWTGYVDCYFDIHRGWSRCESSSNEFKNIYVTHWMPLPEMPKEQ